MNLVNLTTFEGNELTIPVMAAWISKQLVHYRKGSGRIETFIVLIHVVGLNGQMTAFPPHPANLKALKFLLEGADLSAAL
jgi:hypothetical protein